MYTRPAGFQPASLTGSVTLSNNYAYGQPIFLSEGEKLTQVVFRARSSASLTGSVSIRLYNVTPISSSPYWAVGDLITTLYTLNASSITTSTAWFNIVLSTPYTVQTSGSYLLVLLFNISGGDVYLYGASSSAQCWLRSTNGGQSWSTASNGPYVVCTVSYDAVDTSCIASSIIPKDSSTFIELDQTSWVAQGIVLSGLGRTSLWIKRVDLVVANITDLRWMYVPVCRAVVYNADSNGKPIGSPLGYSNWVTVRGCAAPNWERATVIRFDFSTAIEVSNNFVIAFCCDPSMGGTTTQSTIVPTRSRSYFDQNIWFNACYSSNSGGSWTNTSSVLSVAIYETNKDFAMAVVPLANQTAESGVRYIAKIRSSHMLPLYIVKEHITTGSPCFFQDGAYQEKYDSSGVAFMTGDDDRSMYVSTVTSGIYSILKTKYGGVTDASWSNQGYYQLDGTAQPLVLDENSENKLLISHTQPGTGGSNIGKVLTLLNASGSKIWNGIISVDHDIDGGCFKFAGSYIIGGRRDDGDSGSSSVDVAERRSVVSGNVLGDWLTQTSTCHEIRYVLDGGSVAYVLYDQYDGSDKTKDSVVSAYDLTSHQELWSKSKTDTGLYSLVACDKDGSYLYVAGAKYENSTDYLVVHKMSLTDGSIVDTYTAPSAYALPTSICVCEELERLVVSTSNGYFLLIDISTMNFVFAHQISQVDTTVSAASIQALQFFQAPYIIEHPEDVIGATYGSDVEFTVVAGGPNLQYQWYKYNETESEWEEVPGGTEATLQLVATGQTAGVYKCKVYNISGSVYTNTAALTVLPGFTKQPSDTAAVAGSTVKFTVEADGYPTPTLQWYKDDELLSGETSATLEIGPIDYDDEGYYWCRATNEGGYTDSLKAYLSVNEPVTGLTSYWVAAVGWGNDSKIVYGSANSYQILGPSEGKLLAAYGVDVVAAFGKAFVVNGPNKFVVDFADYKLTTENIGQYIPHRGNILTGETSRATGVVEYIDSSSGACNVYVRLLSTTPFVSGETVTGTNDDGNDVSFVVSEFAEPPHWYEWTPYANDETTYGSLPEKATLCCLYRGSLVLSGNEAYPYQWYMSAWNNPWSWKYDVDDLLSGIKGGDGRIGEMNATITALIPWKDNYLIHGTRNSIWMMVGHPRAGGWLAMVSNQTGIWGPQAWCVTPDGTLYFAGNDGIYMMPITEGAQLLNISKQAIPNLISGEIGYGTHRVILTYDKIRHGVLVNITKISTGQNTNYWYDLTTGGWFPESYPTGCGITARTSFQSSSETETVLYGCYDGRIRQFDDSSKVDDVETEVSSYMATIPIELSQGRLPGILACLEGSQAGGGSEGSYPDSDGVQWYVYTGDSAGELAEMMLDDSERVAAIASGQWTGPGRSNKTRIRARGWFVSVLLTSLGKGYTWAIDWLRGFIAGEEK